MELFQYARNVTSQGGEDGIIEKIFSTIGEGVKECVEFGAMDGKTLSNTWNLAKLGWKRVLIEANSAHYKRLLKTCLPKDICAHAKVNFEGQNRLDKILSRFEISSDFDFLSIDIDGNDYHVWASFREFRPRVVVIEFNPTFPVYVEFIQPRSMQVSQGSSFLSLVHLASSKGYKLIATTKINAFFVVEEEFDIFSIEDNRPENIHRKHIHETYLAQLYDGTVLLGGCRRRLWVGGEFKSPISFKETR